MKVLNHLILRVSSLVQRDPTMEKGKTWKKEKEKGKKNMYMCTRKCIHMLLLLLMYTYVVVVNVYIVVVVVVVDVYIVVVVVVVAHVVAVVVVSVAVVLSISNLLYQMLSRAPLQNNMPRSSPPHQQS